MDELCGGGTAVSSPADHDPAWLRRLTVNIGFREFNSFRHFIGTDEQTQRELNHNQVENHQFLFDVAINYQISRLLGYLVSSMPRRNAYALQTRRRIRLGEIVPATIIFDRDGSPIFRIMGEASRKDISSRIDWLLSSRSSKSPKPLLKNFWPALSGVARHRRSSLVWTGDPGGTTNARFVRASRMQSVSRDDSRSQGSTPGQTFDPTRQTSIIVHIDRREGWGDTRASSTRRIPLVAGPRSIFSFSAKEPL